MRRNSKYSALKYVVECQPEGQAFYEQIAAFNSGRVALAYAEECREPHPASWSYRTMARRGNSWALMERAED